MVNNIEYKAGLGKSDHILTKFDCLCYMHMPVTNTHTGNRLIFYKGDYDAIKRDLSILQHSVMSGDNIVHSWSSFTVTLNNIINKYVPVSRAITEKTTKNSYINREYIVAIKRKHQLWIPTL